MSDQTCRPDRQQDHWGDFKAGLYDPTNERDSCGVGLVVDTSGRVSHRTVRDALSILESLEHRSACCEDTGDGAGLLLPLPHAFFASKAAADDTTLPSPGAYGVGQLFVAGGLTTEQVATCRQLVERAVDTAGLRVLWWRDVPVSSKAAKLSPLAVRTQPNIAQVFVARKGSASSAVASDADIQALEQAQWHTRQALRQLLNEAAHSGSLPAVQHGQPPVYVCSFSGRRVVYKGLLQPSQLRPYFPDLQDESLQAPFALVHSRFSTNTFPSWSRAQPNRLSCHNGEINTLRGNLNWMRAREPLLASDYKSLTSGLSAAATTSTGLIEGLQSDSQCLDNVLELLVLSGRPAYEALALLIPPAPASVSDPATRAFVEHHACVQEPWDGPALLAFADDRFVGATLDRNGLRPCRITHTSDGYVLLASEVGVLPFEPAQITQRGRLRPGQAVVIDLHQHRVLGDTEVKQAMASRFPYAHWLELNRPVLEALEHDHDYDDPPADPHSQHPDMTLEADPRVRALSYTHEQIQLLLTPMVADAQEALGSMGNDAALACLSSQNRVLYDYFQQLFAQVTNPPIDPLREGNVMSLETHIGPQSNLLQPSASQSARVRLPEPILSTGRLAALRRVRNWRTVRLDATFEAAAGPSGLAAALRRISSEACAAVSSGCELLLLSDRDMSATRVAIPGLAVAGAVHQALLAAGTRAQASLLVEAADAREVHHICLLLGFGADAVVPWFAYHVLQQMKPSVASQKKMLATYRKALSKGILKVMAKMGISTLSSYKGAQIFEAVGLSEELVLLCFKHTPSKVGGLTLAALAEQLLTLHAAAYAKATVPSALHSGGEYHWRVDGESHTHDPGSISALQEAARSNSKDVFSKYTALADANTRQCMLRGLLHVPTPAGVQSVPLDEVEPAKEIVKRFCTGAMSYGSISIETHQTLAVAMNRLGGRSNTGEGGEDSERTIPLPNGDSKRSAIKQVASARFGVTSFYVASADELQIKLAQGAKPGEGGELPGHKVSAEIARTRHSTPGVTLVSPPPHHDIYSIEDLAQLVHDLQHASPRARVSIKLVAEAGVGVVAAGCAKAGATHVLISGHDGGTGASRWTGIKHAGLPWELGLVEAHHTLVMSNLRGRVTLQADGQMRTATDVLIAALLGADEIGFGTAPLIALGCVMMRKCHLNTCPVGIATQDPELRRRFAGQPEHIINFFFLLAEEMREHMARLGFRKFSQLVGRSDLIQLQVASVAKTPTRKLLTLAPLLEPASKVRPGVATRGPDVVTTPAEREAAVRDISRIDGLLVKAAEKLLPPLGTPLPVTLCRCHVPSVVITNLDRSVGALLSHDVAVRYGEHGLPAGTIRADFTGTAGQSFGAFLSAGIEFSLIGEANDYVGKALSGGRIVLRPPPECPAPAEQSVLVGNVVLYGATSGECFIRGQAAERFAVRNSGARAVVEGCGDHGCEYMTGGCVLVLGPTGGNFAAGMSGGLAFVLDPERTLASRCNTDTVELCALEEAEDLEAVHTLLEAHRRLTESPVAGDLLQQWPQSASKLVKVFPHDYKKVLAGRKKTAASATAAPAHSPANGHIANGHANGAHSKEPTSHVADIEEAVRDVKRDKTRAFLNPRKAQAYRSVDQRIRDSKEIFTHSCSCEKKSAQKTATAIAAMDALKQQAARCMDCGVAFCQSTPHGCPIGNLIPEWNDLVHRDQWKAALDRLLLTNNFPEFTGRVCPAPCEGACVMGIAPPDGAPAPITIKNIELSIIERGWEEGWIRPQPPAARSGKQVAVIGSGPAGLAAAAQLNHAGHLVTVFERADRIGGLLMYGIPNMKLDKELVLQRRLKLMADEGIRFVTGTDIGGASGPSPADLRREYNAVLLATGATAARDIAVPGRQFSGIYPAMDFLTAYTKSLASGTAPAIPASGKRIVVIGGGDTGTDCLATAVRQNCSALVNLELLSEPPAARAPENPWPQWPRIYRVEYGHEEARHKFGQDPRTFAVLTKRFTGNAEGHVTGLETIRVEWYKAANGSMQMRELPGTEQVIAADLVLLAMGFTGPEQPLPKAFGCELDPRGNVRAQHGAFVTSQPNVFGAGDCRRGQSLVVWAINEGRGAARAVDQFLMGQSRLPA